MMDATRLYLALTAFLLAASPCFAEEVLGTWTSDEEVMHVKFDPCGDALCGNVVWVRPDSDVKAKVGQRLFYDMRRDGANSWSGKAVSPSNGSVYLAKISVEGSNLSLTGCVVNGLICKSAKWRRVPLWRAAGRKGDQ
jgi:uncharacterized protein (DUF2147 family)